MYQITFSNQSMAEINKLDKPTQFKIVDAFGSLTKEQIEGGRTSAKSAAATKIFTD